MTLTTRPVMPSLRDAPGIAELFVGVYRRDLLAFFPDARFERAGRGPASSHPASGPAFILPGPDGVEDDDPGSVAIELFGIPYRLSTRKGTGFSPHDLRMIRAMGAVLNLRYLHLFQVALGPRLELFRGGSDDHYVAAFVDPSSYLAPAARVSRIASTILTLRTAALSTYENRPVSTGALLLGPGEGPGRPLAPTPPDALPYDVELTGLKSIHRLCDGARTLFLVDREGRLAEIIEVERWAGEVSPRGGREVPCARAYAAHARATRAGGHVCLVLSPNHEIKLFAEGEQAFAFSHGRWRILDPSSKYAVWESAVADPSLARVLFQTALDLAESRHGGLLVVLSAPPEAEAIGRLIAPHDLVTSDPLPSRPGEPPAQRALHYLARHKAVTELDPAVVEALAAIDGALVADRAGRLIAFGAILRHDAASLPPGSSCAEGARTTAALVASHFGAVLKVSQDGIVSCYLRGSCAWDL